MSAIEATAGIVEFPTNPLFGKVQSQSFRIVIGFALTVVALVYLGGAPARYLIPLASGVTAYVLYRTSPVTYVSFVWWLWFLASFIRRLVDYRSGFTDTSPILGAPFLASLVCLPSLFKKDYIWKRRGSLPFLLGFSSAAYGLFLGLLCIKSDIVLTATLGWFAPLVFGFYILTEYTDEERAETHQRALLRTFCLAVLIMGCYGVIQFFFAPGWDVMWMNGTEMNSIGTPEPFGMRVFSTMNGPGPFAFTMVAGLLLLTQQRGTLPLLASIAGYVSLMLSSVRSAWLALLLSMFLVSLKHRRYRLRLAIAVVVLGGCLAAATAIGPMHEMVSARFQSFTDLQEDASFQGRAGGYEQMATYALSEPFGSGLGTMEAKFAEKTDLGTRDSGFWEVMLSLGWIGGAIYLAALGLVVWVSLRPARRTSTEVVSASIAVGLIAQMLLGSVMLGVTGTTIWMFAAIAMAGQERSEVPGGSN